jgi:hypothetical protein
MESSPDLHLNALFAELDAKLGVAAAAHAAREAAKAHPIDPGKEFTEISRVDKGAASRQLTEADRQLGEQVATSWDLARVQTSAQQVAESGESELHRSAKTCSEVCSWLLVLKMLPFCT